MRGKVTRHKSINVSLNVRGKVTRHKSNFNVSLTVMGQSHKTLSIPQLLKRMVKRGGELNRCHPLTNLTPCRWAKPVPARQRTFNSSGFSAENTLIFASAVVQRELDTERRVASRLVSYFNVLPTRQGHFWTIKLCHKQMNISKPFSRVNISWVKSTQWIHIQIQNENLHTKTTTTKFEELVPSKWPLIIITIKHIRLAYTGVVDYFVWFIDTRLTKE